MLKRKLTFLFSICLIVAFGGNLRAETPAIQFTVDETTNPFSVFLLSFENVTIDWGDGTQSVEPGPTAGQIQINHAYGSTEARTISIYGNKVYNIALNGKKISSITFGNESDLQFLSELYITDNKLTNLDVSKLSKLTVLGCSNNSNLVNLDLSGNPLLGRLLVAGNTSLSGLDVSFNPELIHLNATNTGLTSINLDNNNKLQELHLNDNKIESLDLSGLTDLQVLSCSNNKISNLDLLDSPGLKRLICGKNKLTTLNLNPLVTSLVELQCENNVLNFATLPRVSKAVGATNFSYLPQDSLSMDNRAVGMVVDLSDQFYVSGNFPGTGTAPVKSRAIWLNAVTNARVTSFTESNGVFTFTLNSSQKYLLRAEIQNTAYSGLLLKTKVVSLPGVVSSVKNEVQDINLSFSGGVLHFGNESDNYIVRISDTFGKLILTTRVSNNELDLRSVLKKGSVYFVSATSKDKQEYLKIVGQ